jgi:hypothetical protein
MLTEIYLCHDCSCHEISRMETPGQVFVPAGAPPTALGAEAVRRLQGLCRGGGHFVRVEPGRVSFPVQQAALDAQNDLEAQQRALRQALPALDAGAVASRDEARQRFVTACSALEHALAGAGALATHARAAAPGHEGWRQVSY